MNSIRSVVGDEIRRVRAASPPLFATGVSFLALTGLSLLVLAVDHRVITGSPAWLKPTKFAISTAAYCLTLAWVAAQVGRPSRLLSGAGWVIAVVLIIEVGIIDLQAARGTTSHFNIAAPLDAALFAVMGLGIATLLLASIAATVAVCRASFADRPWGWALRLGMVVTVVGMSLGGLMLGPTPAQLAAIEVGGHPATRGSHTVGGPDSGPGLAMTGWSRVHGDLRVPHFVGLHAIQTIPLLAWLAFVVIGPRSDRTRSSLVGLIATSYLGLIGLANAASAGRSPGPGRRCGRSSGIRRVGGPDAGWIRGAGRGRPVPGACSHRFVRRLSPWTPRRCFRGVAGWRWSVGSC